MKHLIVGAGNMGRRHGRILKSLGDQVEYVDIGWSGSVPGGMESVLICTPPETHIGYINRLSGFGIPIFVEKPVCVDLSSKVRLPVISMVACNWRWCRHIKKAKKVILSYNLGRYGSLDLIHFVDFYWGREMRLASPFKLIAGETMIELRDGEVRTWVDGFSIRKHAGICGMFIEQMKEWRNSVLRRTEYINPICNALERTRWLMKELGYSA